MRESNQDSFPYFSFPSTPTLDTYISEKNIRFNGFSENTFLFEKRIKINDSADFRLMKESVWSYNDHTIPMFIGVDRNH